MRLIDADAAYERAQADSRRGALEDWEFDMIVNLLDSAPTVDAVPVVHGKWILHATATGQEYTVCNQCFTDFNYRPAGEKVFVKINMQRAPYCSFCGAKMDGGDPDGR